MLRIIIKNRIIKLYFDTTIFSLNYRYNVKLILISNKLRIYNNNNNNTKKKNVQFNKNVFNDL